MKWILIMTILASVLGLLGLGKANAEDNWTVATGDDNGKPMIVRFRSEIPTGVDIKGYPHLLAISWKYASENDGGMPSESDNNRMILLEKLLNSLEDKRTAYMTVAVTCNGVKEWQWYSRDIDETMSLLNSELSAQAQFPIEISLDEDPEWSAYLKFKNGAK